MVENGLFKLASYGSTGVLLALIGLIAYLTPKVLKFFTNLSNQHLESHDRLNKSIEKNTQISNQTYEYLKLKNGAMEKLLNDSVPGLPKRKTK